MMTARKVIGALAVITIILVLAAPASNYLLAQESSPGSDGRSASYPHAVCQLPTAYAMQGLGFTLIGHADFQIETDGQVRASAATHHTPSRHRLAAVYCHRTQPSSWCNQEKSSSRPTTQQSASLIRAR